VGNATSFGEILAKNSSFGVEVLVEDLGERQIVFPTFSSAFDPEP
jgi:hypothetical protein